MSKKMENRKTIRITSRHRKQLKKLMNTGKWLHEASLIRQALGIGLDQLEKDLGKGGE